MNNNKRYFFRKADKLKSRKTIQAIFAKGKSFVLFPLKVTWLNNQSAQHLQAGIGASSRNFKRAVDRNRIKRLMREAWRLQKNDLYEQLQQNNQHLSVFIIYIGKELPKYELIYQKMGNAIQRLYAIINENTETHI